MDRGGDRGRGAGLEESKRERIEGKDPIFRREEVEGLVELTFGSSNWGGRQGFEVHHRAERERERARVLRISPSSLLLLAFGLSSVSLRYVGSLPRSWRAVACRIGSSSLSLAVALSIAE